MLHIISKILPDHLLQHCISTVKLQQDACILLYQDGVYLALVESEYWKWLDTQIKAESIYVLIDDIRARGIENKLLDKVMPINYEEFVKLTIQHDKVISW